VIDDQHAEHTKNSNGNGNQERLPAPPRRMIFYRLIVRHLDVLG
jgi:hypothetical protein